MGTRHTQSVITKKGELKIKQYGQWDGYPSGQGIGILEYLRNGNLEKYQENLENIPPVTDEQVTEIDKDPNWKQEYPYLSRDCGSKIHQMIEDGEVKFVQLIDEEESRKWCEGFYTIDFSKNEFVVDWDGIHTFKLDALPTNEEFLAATKSDE